MSSLRDSFRSLLCVAPRRLPQTDFEFAAEAEEDGVRNAHVMQNEEALQSPLTNYALLVGAGFGIVRTDWPVLLSGPEIQILNPSLPTQNHRPLPLPDAVLAAQNWNRQDFGEVCFRFPQQWSGANADGTYSVWFNLEAGVIVTSVMHPPLHLIVIPASQTRITYVSKSESKDAPPATRPSELADIIFLIHKRLCHNLPGYMQRLRFVFSSRISDLPTFSVANFEKFGKKQRKWNTKPKWPGDAWPGVQFAGGMGPEYLSGNRLVGTWTGKLWVRLLATHLDGYGMKTIDQVHLYSTGEDENGDANLGIGYRIKGPR